MEIKCVFWFSLRLLSETFLILRRIQRDITINVRVLHVEHLSFLSHFNETWFSYIKVSENSSNVKFHQNPSNESRVVPHEQTDGQTDMTKPIVAFLNFANAPKDVNRQPGALWKRTHVYARVHTCPRAGKYAHTYTSATLLPLGTLILKCWGKELTPTNQAYFNHLQLQLWLHYGPTKQFNCPASTRWFKYDRDKLWLVYTQIVPPCTCILHIKWTWLLCTW